MIKIISWSNSTTFSLVLPFIGTLYVTANIAVFYCSKQVFLMVDILKKENPMFVIFCKSANKVAVFNQVKIEMMFGI